MQTDAGDLETWLPCKTVLPSQITDDADKAFIFKFCQFSPCLLIPCLSPRAYLICRGIMQLPYISLEQHNTGKRGRYFLKSELTWRRWDPGRWAGRPPHLDTVHGGPWPGRGLVMEGGRLHKSSSLLQPRPNPFVNLDYFPILCAGRQHHNCKDSQCALLWHETQILFSFQPGLSRGLPESICVVSKPGALKQMERPRMTNTREHSGNGCKENRTFMNIH